MDVVSILANYFPLFEERERYKEVRHFFFVQTSPYNIHLQRFLISSFGQQTCLSHFFKLFPHLDKQVTDVDFAPIQQFIYFSFFKYI